MTKILRSAKRVANTFIGNPDEVVIEPTTRCNLFCLTCSSMRDQMQRARGDMGIYDFQNMTDELNGKAFRMTFVGSGEPLMNENIFEMIQFAKQRDFKTFMLTISSGL